MEERVSVIRGDITHLSVDAIVNAANTSLLGGGGVDGAIHDAAGPQLLEECRTLGGCETGQVKVTRGYNLPANFVIHAVGPIYRGGNAGEADLLASCYRNAMEAAKMKRLSSIAFPCISTGIYGYPIEEAAEIAVDIVCNFLEETEADIEVTFCCFSASDEEVYRRLLE